MQSSLLGTCVLETDRPDTAGCDQVPTCLASGENTWKSLLPRAGRCRPCSVNSCDAGAHPASSAEYGSQMPPCDPNLTRPKRLGDHHCSSVRRANGLVQTCFWSVISERSIVFVSCSHTLPDVGKLFILPRRRQRPCTLQVCATGSLIQTNRPSPYRLIKDLRAFSLKGWVYDDSVNCR